MKWTEGYKSKYEELQAYLKKQLSHDINNGLDEILLS